MMAACAQSQGIPACQSPRWWQRMSQDWEDTWAFPLCWSQEYDRDAACILKPAHPLKGETKSRVCSQTPAGPVAVVSPGQLNKHRREAFLTPKSSVLTEVQRVLSDWFLSTG